MNRPSLNRLPERLSGWLIPGALYYPTEHRRLRLFWADGVTANVAEALIVAYSGLYLLSVGASTSLVGLQAAVVNLMAALAFFPGARLVEHWGRRKHIVVLSGGGAARLALLGLVVAPFFFKSPALIFVLIACTALRGFFNSLANPAWTSLAADLVPLRLRGRYFASRQFGMAIASFVSTILAGLAIARAGAPAGYQWSFFVAFLFGLASTVFFARIPEPHSPPAQRDPRAPPVDATFPAARRTFALYVLTQFIWGLSLQTAGPFFNIYIVKGLSGSAADVGLLTGISTLTTLVGLRFFGPRTDHRGPRWTVRTTGLLIPFLPWMWLVVQAPWQIVFIQIPSGFLWAGYELGTFALLLALTPDAQRPRLVATYQTLIFTTAFLGPLIGGYLVGAFGFKLVFFLSGLGRMIAMLLFSWLVHEPGRPTAAPPAQPAQPAEPPQPAQPAQPAQPEEPAPSQPAEAAAHEDRAEGSSDSDGKQLAPK